MHFKYFISASKLNLVNYLFDFKQNKTSSTLKFSKDLKIFQAFTNKLTLLQSALLHLRRNHFAVKR